MTVVESLHRCNITACVYCYQVNCLCQLIGIYPVQICVKNPVDFVTLFELIAPWATVSIPRYWAHQLSMEKITRQLRVYEQQQYVTNNNSVGLVKSINLNIVVVINTQIS
jgi:hypothetical protein